MWNAPLDADALCAALDDMHAHGLRNVCIHPFPKGFRSWLPTEMEPGYLTDGYLDVFAKVVHRAGELGMHAYLYDEGGWPSGGACGLVAASDAEGAFSPREALPTRDGNVDVRRRSYPKGFASYPSIIERGTTDRFIELTHDALARCLGDAIGTTVRIAFTDEPDMPRDASGKSLAWTADFGEEFRRRKGYTIEPFVAALVADAEHADASLSQVRIDLMDVRADLFVQRFLTPVRDWCRSRGMLSGGHLNNEDQPEREAELAHGSLLRSLRALDVPGVDVIWRQLFPGKEANPFPRYAASAMHQNGGRFALSETFAIFGDSVSPAQMKWVVDYEMVRGINLFVLAYYAQSNARHWMTLFEPHFGPDSPTWDFMPHFFHYIERTSRFLSQGRPGAEIVVLINNRAFWANKADRDAATAAHYAAARELDAMNCDYDFAEDRDIASAKVTADGTLRIGAMEYRAVVLPSEAWVLPEAKEALSRFEASGGIVAHGLAQLANVRRTLALSGDGARSIRVMKRIDGDRRIWFLVNEDMEDRMVEIAFPDVSTVVRYDPENDCHEAVPVGDGGVVRHVFGPGETAFFISGDPASLVSPVGPTSLVSPASPGISRWTLRPLVSHVAGAAGFEIRRCDSAAWPVTLGDWRGVLGETFCGKALYRAEFDSPDGGDAILDLGEVKWCASVRLNGEDLGARFFGPFRWRVRLAKGRNVLEVTVANLLANQIGDDAIRDRILRDWQPNGSYDKWQSTFDKLNHESGLYGPVTLSRIARCVTMETL